MSGNRELLPKGVYSARIVFVDDVETKAGDGKMVKLVLGVEGCAARVYEYHLYRHRNKYAEKKGREKLRQLGEATGIAGLCPQNIHALDSRFVDVRIDIEEGKNGYPPSNKVREYLEYSPKRSWADEAVVDENLPF